MRHSPAYIVTDPAIVRRLIEAAPWATFISITPDGLTASHYPILLEPQPDPDAITIVSHFGRPDDETHRLGAGEILVIVQGPHGYISPSWYDGDGFIPTWDHVTAHLYGTPELLSAEENFAVLTRLVDHFEQHVPDPCALRQDETTARRVALGTTGLRLRVTRFEARLKLSQNKSLAIRQRVVRELERGERHPYRNPALAAELRRHFTDLAGDEETGDGIGGRLAG